LAEDGTPVSMSLDEPLPPHYAWNARALIADSALFPFAANFFSSTTVLPGLITALGGSEVVVGLAVGLIGGAWLLPQLLIASVTARLPRKKPLLVAAAWISRPLFLVLALVLLLFGRSHPLLTLTVVIVGIVVFFMLDAAVSMPWFDLLGRIIPPTRRGRVLGTAEVLGGLAGIVAGLIVRDVLRANSPWRFPANYAVLFVLASVLLLCAALALSLIREPRSAVAEKGAPPLREVLRMLPRILIEDRPFLRLVAVKLLTGFITLANAFYVLFATRNLGLSADVTGLFVSAQVVGTLVAGLVMTQVQDRLGPLAHMRILIGSAALPPILALILGPLAGALGSNVLYPFLLVYFLLGLYTASFGWPFFNWILEYVDEARRPLYIGMLNTLGAAAMVAPALGGWIVRTISYPAVFALSACLVVVTFILSLPLPDTRRKR
jgi:MFS family permease